MPSRHSDRDALTAESALLHMVHTVPELSLMRAKVTRVTEEPAPRPRPHHDWLRVDKNTAGRPPSNSGLLQILNIIFPISFVTIPPVPIPFAQTTSGPFHTPSPPPRPLLPHRQSPLPEPPSLVALEAPILLLSPPFPACFRRCRHHHRLRRLSVPPIVLYMDGRRPLSSTPQSLLHSLFHLLRPSSLLSPMPRGLDTVFPQIPRQALLLSKVPIVLRPHFLMFPTESLLDPPVRHPHMGGIYLRAAHPPLSLLNARPFPTTLILRVFSPRLRPLMFSRP